jgi:homoserine kinase
MGPRDIDKTAVTVRVPATTANLGPGFDCLGMALDLWNEIRVTPADHVSVSVTGEGEDTLPSGAGNLVYRSIQRLFEAAGAPPPLLGLRCLNRIPLERGLGSSAAAIVGGLVAGRALLDRTPGGDAPRFEDHDLLDMAVDIEGHPDNVSAALLGGLRLIVSDEGSLLAPPVPLPADLRSVIFVPRRKIATEDARAVLPRTVSREDAVYNMGRVGLLVNALASGRLEDLPAATRDRLHQPYRQRLFPAMKVIFRAALDAGGLGVFLSGSGSTILALTRGKEMTVAYEMAEAARQANVEGDVKVTSPTPLGAHLVGIGE